MTPLTDPERLRRIDDYYRVPPQPDARAQRVGGCTVFVGSGAPVYRSALATRESAGATAADLDRAFAFQRELGVPPKLEWTAEQVPDLLPVARAAGLTLRQCPLLVLRPEEHTLPPSRAPTPQPPVGVTLRRLGADDPALTRALTVSILSFQQVATGTTGVSPADIEASTALYEPAAARMSRAIRADRTSVVAAEEAGRPVGAGLFQRVDGIEDVGELCGIGVLPDVRRRGVGLGLTTALVREARRLGTATVFLVAADEEVARVYERAGFDVVGTRITAWPKHPAPDGPVPVNGGAGGTAGDSDGDGSPPGDGAGTGPGSG